MKKVVLILLCFMLIGCSVRNNKMMPTLDVCPEPQVPEFSGVLDDGHISSINVLDSIVGDFLLLKNYTIKLKNTNTCYKKNLETLTKEFSKKP